MLSWHQLLTNTSQRCIRRYVTKIATAQDARQRIQKDCCLSYWAQSIEGDMKSLIQVKPNHKCDPKKVAHAINVLDIQNKKNELYGEFIDFLVMLARYLTAGTLFSQRNIYLKAEELVPPSYPCDLTAGKHDSNVQSAATNNSNKDPLLSTQEEQSTDLTNIKENNWANRIIKEEEQLEKSIVMNNDELIDFVRTVRATFGTFRVQMGEDMSTRYFFMYFSILN
jgi:hypothetical protein